MALFFDLVAFGVLLFQVYCLISLLTKGNYTNEQVVGIRKQIVVWCAISVLLFIVPRISVVAKSVVDLMGTHSSHRK